MPKFDYLFPPFSVPSLISILVDTQRVGTRERLLELDTLVHVPACDYAGAAT